MAEPVTAFAPDDREMSALSSNAPITSLYLTFSTPLPRANTIHSSLSPSQSPLPPPLPSPDLRPYQNPQTFPSTTKLTLLTLSSLATFLTAYSAGVYSPPSHLLQASFSPSPPIEAVLTGITTFCLGFALAPMILAPLSELNGRYPVFVVAGTVFVVCQALCGVVRTLAGMLVVRFFVGAGASVFSSMVGGVIADMWDARERNMPMAVFSGAVLAGTGAGPLVGSVMAERLAEGNKWRWVFWHQAVAGGLLMAALAVMWRETRGSVVLSRKARALNRWYEALEGRGYYGVWVEEGMGGEGDEEKRMGTTQEGSKLRRIRWVVKEDEERASLATMIRISVTRPFHLLFTEPVVFFFSLWAAFAWGVLYLTFGSVPYVFQTVYGWPLSGSGYAFSAMVIGAVVATGMGIWQEKLLRHPKWASPAEDGTNSSEEIPSPLPKLPPSKLDPFWAYLRAHFPPSTPESRLYPTCLTSTLLPLGLFTFGFTAQPQLSPAGPLVGIFLSTLGIFSVYLAVFNYFADTYQGYASSALAAQSFCRNVLGGAFPLVTRRLYGDLGPVKAGAVLGGVAVVLTGVPWVLVLLGEGVRGRSGFAKKLVHT